MASGAEEKKSSLATRALALVVLIVATYLVFKFVIGLITTIVWAAVAVIAVLGVLWALSVLR